MTTLVILWGFVATVLALAYRYETRAIEKELALADRDVDAALHREIKAAAQAARLAVDAVKHMKRLAIAHQALTNIQTQNAGQLTFEVWAKQIAKDALMRITPLEPTEVFNPPMPAKL